MNAVDKIKKRADLALVEPDTSKATQSNKLIEASYRMSVPAKRVFLMMLGHVHPKMHTLPDRIKINAADYASKTGISRAQAYRDIKNGSKELMRTIVTMKKTKTTAECVVVQGHEYHEGEGWVEASFSKWIAPYIHQLSRDYTTLKIDEAIQFSRLYTVRLYELLMQFEKTGERRISVDNLRRVYQIEEHKYPRFSDFRKWVLEPSLAEIQEKTDWIVAWQPVRTSRKITSIELIYERDDQPDLFK